MEPLALLLPAPPSILTFGYTANENYASFSNLLLISYAVHEYEQFVVSVNSTTFPIVFYKNTDFEYLKNFLFENFKKIDRICFVTHGLSSDVTNDASHFLPFVSKQMFFVESDLNSSSYSPGIENIRTLVETLSVQHVDFLGCNLLLYIEWQMYFGILSTFSTNPKIGASDNNSGNLKQGGDWVLETTMEDVQNIYFTNEIENYTDVLSTYTAVYNDAGTNRTFTYTSNGDVINISSLVGNVTIPSYLNSIPLTILSMSSSTGATNSLMTSLTVSSGFTTIGYQPSYDEDAFYGSTQLTSVSLPNTLLYIGGGSFASSSKLSTVTLPSSLLSLGGIYTYNGCFADCWLLSTISIPPSVTYIGTSCFANNQNKSSMIQTVTFNGNSLQTIDNYAFFQCNLTNVTIPVGVLSLGSFSFYGTKVTSISLPYTTLSVGDSCFPTALASVYIPANSQLQSIGNSNPFGNSITSITLPNSLLTINNMCFQGCNNIFTLFIPSSVTFIGAQAFYGMSNVTSIFIGAKSNALSNCSYLFANCTNLSQLAFSTCIFSAGSMLSRTTFLTSNNITSITVTDPSSSNVFLFTGNYRNIYSTITISRIINFDYLTLAYIIPPLPAFSNNVYTIPFIDTTTLNLNPLSGQQYFNFTFTTFYLRYATLLQGNTLTISHSVPLPGYSAPITDFYVFNSVIGLQPNYTNTISSSYIKNKSFYVLMDSSGDNVTFNTLNQTAVMVTKNQNYSVLYGYQAQPRLSTDTFTLEGLSFLFGGLYGQLSNAVTNRNAYSHCFYTVNPTLPTILNRNIYDNCGNLLHSINISFAGMNVLHALSLLDNVNAPFTLGFVDEVGSAVTMDLAYCSFFRKWFNNAFQQKIITYTNTFVEPRSEAIVFNVTVSNGIFLINGIQQTVTFFTGNLYLFDQSHVSNLGNTLVLGTHVDVLSSIVPSIYNGTPGSINAYTLIDYSGTTPLYLFSKTTPGMG